LIAQRLSWKLPAGELITVVDCKENMIVLGIAVAALHQNMRPGENTDNYNYVCYGKVEEFFGQNVTLNRDHKTHMNTGSFTSCSISSIDTMVFAMGNNAGQVFIYEFTADNTGKLINTAERNHKVFDLHTS
jgi:hypothetical protein